ncbi:MAG: HlyD family secretion protein [Betaproteobacteria bacterium]|nr:HlyD family secretion protein [Betaproteobacteria bacterium]
MTLRNIFRIAFTLAAVAVALWLGRELWQHYMNSPWTRDGRVRANIIQVAPEVSGAVTEMRVHDNQQVQKGDVLFIINPDSYRIALSEAEARVRAAKAQFEQAQRQAERRRFSEGAIAQEERDNTQKQAEVAEANYAEAVAARDRAALDLGRTTVRAPVTGFVTNLVAHRGDYATAGTALLAMIDSESFYIYGYFEENKLTRVREGAKVDIKLLGGARLSGHVESIARGIGESDNQTGNNLLVNVNPSFTWVRLAQRLPVRIHIDQIPEGVTLAAGMTCTVVIRDQETEKK